MVPVGTKGTWQKYGAFLNEFHSEVKQLILRFEQIKIRIGKHKDVSRENASYICVCVCFFFYVLLLCFLYKEFNPHPATKK